jgi:hypothetical protein
VLLQSNNSRWHSSGRGTPLCNRQALLHTQHSAPLNPLQHQQQVPQLLWPQYQQQPAAVQCQQERQTRVLPPQMLLLPLLRPLMICWPACRL